MGRAGGEREMVRGREGGGGRWMRGGMGTDGGREGKKAREREDREKARGRG